MKRLFFFFIMMPAVLFAQNDVRYLSGAVPEVDGKVVFSKKIQAPSLSQEQLFEILSDWSANYYNGEKNRVVYQNSEEGAIACVGNEYLVFSSSALSLDRSQINYLMRIVCQNQSCEIQMSGIRYEYNVSYQKEPEKYSAEEWITDRAALKNNKLLRVPGKFRTKTIDLADKLFNQVTNKINERVSASVSASASALTQSIPVSPATVVTAPVSVAEVKASVSSEPATTTSSSLEGYKKIAPDKIPGNIIKMIQNDLMMITAKNDQETDFATTSWGGLGYAINKPVAFCLTESGNNISTVLETTSTYTLSFYTEAYRDVLERNKENRLKDSDKVNKSGLTLLTTPEGSKAFSEAWMIIECKKISTLQAISSKENSLEGSKVLLGEILNVWIK